MNDNSLINILDCSFRDGGYYNNWDFSDETLAVYYEAMFKSGVNAIELGFRSLPKSSFMGPYLYTTDNFLDVQKFDDKVEIGVMINASEFLHYNEKCLEYLSLLFRKKCDSKVSLVRVAVNFELFNDCCHILDYFKSLGYRTGFNLMQAHNRTHEEYYAAGAKIQSWGNVDILYFADSLGSMNATEVQSICSSILSSWSGQLGIHAHDNKGLALSNTFTAIKNGVKWCDSTVLGMGRGAGNVSTESLLMELVNEKLHQGDPFKLKNITSIFSDLKRNFSWGPNPYYHYAANKCVHPTFVQSLLSDSRYDGIDCFSVLENISKSKASSFNEDKLKEVAYGCDNVDCKGSWDATNWLKDRNVLVIGSGPSVKKYLRAIAAYVKNEDCFVVTLNVNRKLDGIKIDAAVVSHLGRALLDSVSYEDLPYPIIMPKKSFSDKIGKKNNNNILDYGLEVKPDSFEINSNGCVLSSPLAISYALSVLTQASAKELKLVGFDGYNLGDPKQEEVKNIFIEYQKLEKAIPLESLTFSSYPIRQNSVFAPIIKSPDYLVVIPARYNSSRFPGKPLANISGKSLINRVWQKCADVVDSENIVVATDDKRIERHCIEKGMNVIMTSSKCLTGTDRLYEVATKIKRKFYINVQGDEPFIDSNDILRIIAESVKRPNQVINGMCEIMSENEFRSPNVPKVVTTVSGELLYMSRAAIPTCKSLKFIKSMRQVCIYAFPRSALMAFGRNEGKTLNEKIEDIEILRFLDLGYKVRMIECSWSGVAVDTEEDIHEAEKLIKENLSLN